MMRDEIVDLLKQRTGLDAESVGAAAIACAVRSRMAQCGVQQLPEYSRLLRESDEELQQLIEAVIVPETWFFRDHEAFTALANLTRNAWHPPIPGDVLRVLSVPCSTGEEAYSAVMALLDGGISPQRFQVDAMDISRAALVRAERAVYGKNSFRSQELAFRARYFSSQPDGFHLAETVRERVRFQHGNLLDFEFGANSYDVIFCRNLLIYFDAPTQEFAIAKLRRLLAENGVLFVGPAEAFLVRRGELAPIRQPRTFAFQKISGKNDISPAKSTPLRAAGIIPLKIERRRKARPASKPIVKAPLVLEKPQLEMPENTLENAMRLADAGRIAEAEALCEAHLKSVGVSADAYYLLALTRDAQGNFQGARDCYRRVLYLQPDHAEALAHLALLLEKQGDEAGARRLRERGRRTEERAKGTQT